MRRRFLWIGISVLGALGALAALWTIPNLEERPLVVRTDDVVPVRRGAAPDTLRFGVAHVLAADRSSEGLAPLARLLSQPLGQPVRIIERGRYQEVNDLLRSGGVDVALIGAGAYLRARHDRIALEAVSVPLRLANGTADHSVTIVRTRTGIRSFAELEGRPFAFSDPLSLPGHYYPLLWAAAEGLDPQAFFRHATFTYDHTRSIEAVLDGAVDGASVDASRLAAETRKRPDIALRLRVVHESPPLAPSVVVVPSSARSARLQRRLRAALVDLASTPVGRAALEQQGIERFIPPPAGVYDEAQRAFDDLMARLEEP